jgi:hypothetical protein
MAPLVRGADVYAYHLAPPERFAPIAQAEDPSLWARLRWNAAEGAFICEDTITHVPEFMVASAVIGITLNAALIQPYSIAAQDTTLLSVWADDSVPPHCLLGLLNSQLLRWYSWILLRSGVTGGGRRDHHTYPRTIASLPAPSRPAPQWAETIAAPVSDIVAVASRAAVLDPEIWAATLERFEPTSTLAAWGLRWQAWPEDKAVTSGARAVARERDDCLRLSRTVALTADDPALLDFLEVHLPLVFDVTPRITREAAQALPVPEPKAVPRLLQAYRDTATVRDTDREEYLRLVEVIDEAVFSAYDLPARLEKNIRKRMTEFPLSDYAANYRKPWEPTRRPHIKLFIPGQRYHG